MENVCNENNICADSKNHEKFSQLTLKSQKRLAIYRCVPIIGKQSPTFETKKKRIHSRKHRTQNPMATAKLQETCTQNQVWKSIQHNRRPPYKAKWGSVNSWKLCVPGQHNTLSSSYRRPGWRLRARVKSLRLGNPSLFASPRFPPSVSLWPSPFSLSLSLPLSLSFSFPVYRIGHAGVSCVMWYFQENVN